MIHPPREPGDPDREFTRGEMAALWAILIVGVVLLVILYRIA